VLSVVGVVLHFYGCAHDPPTFPFLRILSLSDTDAQRDEQLPEQRSAPKALPLHRQSLRSEGFNGGDLEGPADGQEADDGSNQDHENDIAGQGREVERSVRPDMKTGDAQ